MAASTSRLLGWTVNERVEVLAIACAIDVQAVDELEQRVRASHENGPDHVVIDLKALPDLPAPELGALISTLCRLAHLGTSFGVVCPHGILGELPERVEGEDVAVFATVTHALAHAPPGALERIPPSRRPLRAQSR